MLGFDPVDGVAESLSGLSRRQPARNRRPPPRRSERDRQPDEDPREGTRGEGEAVFNEFTPSSC